MKQKTTLPALLLALCMILLTACGGSGNQPGTEPQPSQSQPVQSEPVESQPVESQEPETPEVKQDLADYLWEIPEDATLEEKVKLELRNYSLIQTMEPIFDPETYSAYSKTAVSLRSRANETKLAALQEAKANLVQTISVEDGIFFIWKDFESMPIVDGESYTEEELDASSLQGYGYTTTVVKYLIDDPTQAKGNIVACSGGAMKGRSNGAEGYPAAEAFNALGYNYFLVQRRVEPYSELDIFMDFGRTIRVVRYYAEQEGWGGQDMICGMGWSGGGGTVIGAVNYFYGDVQFSQYDSDYVPDEIDAVSMDLDVAMPIYGTGENRKLELENSRLPAFYSNCGSADEKSLPNFLAFFEAMKDFDVPVKYTIIEGAPHGYGVGTTNDEYPEGCRTWVHEADEFMQEHRGYQANWPVDFPEAPEEYVKAKAFHGYYAFVTESDVVFALSEDESKFCVKFSDFIGEHVLWGVVEGGVCTVDASLVGLYGEDVQWMYEEALELETPWVAIARN